MEGIAVYQASEANKWMTLRGVRVSERVRVWCKT